MKSTRIVRVLLPVALLVAVLWGLPAQARSSSATRARAGDVFAVPVTTGALSEGRARQDADPEVSIARTPRAATTNKRQRAPRQRHAQRSVRRLGHHTWGSLLQRSPDRRAVRGADGPEREPGHTLQRVGATR